jgi:phosphate transport system substrate-binding protein
VDLSPKCHHGAREPGLTGEIKASGSSTVHPLTSAVAESFVKQHPDVKISVASSGTSAGFQQFCRGEIDVQSASRPINADERAACERSGVAFLEIPVAYDALTIIVHPANDWTSSISVAELKRLWEPDAEGKVTRWSDVKPGWPNEPIKLFGPGARASRKDYSASEDDTVIVKGVSADRYALGYVGFGYFHQNEKALKAVPLAGPDAERLGAVLPSIDNVQRGAYRPLSRTLFVYVNGKSLNGPALSQFVTFYLKQDQSLVREVGGIPMTARAYELVQQRVAKKVPGTLFPDGQGNQSLEMVLTRAQ